MVLVFLHPYAEAYIEGFGDLSRSLDGVGGKNGSPYDICDGSMGCVAGKWGLKVARLDG